MLHHIQELLTKIDANFLSRKRYVIENVNNDQISIDGKVLFNFSSNDYLNIASHPNVKKAFAQGAMQYGLGSGSSALVSGYSTAHRQLEEEFAEFLNRERALLFNSGYHANLGVITTFAGRHNSIVADKLCHASLIDGIVLSRARYQRYQHNDLSHAEKLIQKNSLLVTESVFSMQGNITNVKKLAAIATDNNAMLIVDDAHGFGVLGSNGKGICDYYHLSQKDVPCLITPLGKAAAGFGAIVSGSHDTIEAILQSARSYRYSTAMPPAICEATREVLNIIKNESWRRDKLCYLIRHFIKEVKERDLPLVSQDETPIKSILIGTSKNTLEIQHTLMQLGYLVSCIRPPTVPQNTARIRISLNCSHREEQITHLLDHIKEYHGKN